MFLVNMRQSVTDQDRRQHPPCVEWEAAHGEVLALHRSLAANGSSDGHILSELRAWSEGRPLPVLAAFQRAVGMKVDREPTVADLLRVGS